jgi:pilus assembly protein CpaF
MSPAPDGDLVTRVRRRLATGEAPPGAREVADAWRVEAAVGVGVQDLRTVTSELLGAGPLEPLLADPEVDDILVNGPDQVWVDRRGQLVRTSVRFADEATVRRLAVRLIAATGRRLDAAAPYADATLPDGSRLHAVLPPVAIGGTCLSIRVLRRRRFDLDGLVGGSGLPSGMADLLRSLVFARLAAVISGGTGTGKTTLLGAMLSAVPVGQRLVLVEDAAELAPVHPHVVRLQARPPNVEGAGTVTLRDLVRQALRMRPDRLVLGEVRGAEIVDLFAALNTGHDGSLTTLHANSAADVPPRIEALAALAGLPRAAAHSQLAATVRVVVHLRRTADGRRQIGEIALLVPDREGFVRPVTVLDALGSRPARGPAARELAQLLTDRGVDVPEVLVADQ